MPGTTEIRDHDVKGFLEVDLQEVLSAVEAADSHLIWSILDLDSTAEPGKLKRDLSKLEADIQRSSQGLILTWDELVSLANSLSEVRDAIIVGCRTRELIPALPTTDLYSPCDVVIEAVDSAFWRIYAKDDRLLQKLARTFRDVDVTNSSPTN
jgi:hypothetical protein